MANRWNSPKSENKNEPRAAVVDLAEGTSALLIRVPAGGKSNLHGVARDHAGGRPAGRIQRGRWRPRSAAAVKMQRLHSQTYL